MGLDMFLNKHTFIGGMYDHQHVTGKVNLKINGKPVNIKTSRINTIVERMGYWRKANHIHKWFVANVQAGDDDCGEYYVPPEKLSELLKICKEIQGKPSRAAELLPTQSGFFFGGTDYDEGYMNDIKDTVNIIESALQETDGDIYYRASW